jgi:hypothetical protein
MSCCCWPCKPKPIPSVPYEHSVTVIRPAEATDLKLTSMIIKGDVTTVTTRPISHEEADTMFNRVKPNPEGKTSEIGHVRFQSTEQVSLHTALKTLPSRSAPQAK